MASLCNGRHLPCFPAGGEVVRRSFLRAETMVAGRWKREPVQMTPQTYEALTCRQGKGLE